jgi:hypothetical protein
MWEMVLTGTVKTSRGYVWLGNESSVVRQVIRPEVGEPTMLCSALLLRSGLTAAPFSLTSV